MKPSNNVQIETCLLPALAVLIKFEPKYVELSNDHLGGLYAKVWITDEARKSLESRWDSNESCSDVVRRVVSKMCLLTL